MCSSDLSARSAGRRFPLATLADAKARRLRRLAAARFLIAGQAFAPAPTPAPAAKTLALALREEEPEKLLVFDLDQTKGMFRLRDLSPRLEGRGVRLIHGEEFLDSPLVPGGVAEALADPARRVILDVGGGQNGARTLGRYRELLGEGTTQALLPVNPFRRPGLTAQSLGEELAATLA